MIYGIFQCLYCQVDFLILPLQLTLALLLYQSLGITLSTTTMGSVTNISLIKEDEENPNWNLTEVECMLLRQTDEEYEPHSWEELKWIIGMLQFLHF